VLLLALTSFGGPQAHIAHFLRVLVTKRAYLSEADLIELNALCNILPGPTSTQTITAIGYKIGGAKLAYLTLLVWMLPAVLIMTTAGIIMSNLHEKDVSISFTKFIQPMAVGFVSYAAYMISRKTVNSKTGLGLMILAGIAAYFIRTPYVFPAILLVAGLTTSFKFKAQPKEEKNGLKIQWNNFALWAGVLIFAALLGWATKSIPELTLPVRLFENFYRNGSLIFGGGQVLIPLLYTEFVQFKQYLSSQEFLSGYAMAQSVPGPVFSFTAYIGALSMREYGIFGEILGALAATFGVFLPGTFLIFFVIRFWEDLKKYRPVRASLEGINAASAGLVAAAAILLYQPLDNNIMNVSFIIGTFCLLNFTRIPHPIIIVGGLAAGLLL